MKKIHKKYFEKYYPLYYTRKIMKSKKILGKYYRKKRICITKKYKTIKTQRSRISLVIKGNGNKGSLYLGPIMRNYDPEL